jgi:2-keto-4-pentenoate hydratase
VIRRHWRQTEGNQDQANEGLTCAEGLLENGVMISMFARVGAVLLLVACVCSAADTVQQLSDDFFGKRATSAVASNVTAAEALRLQEQFVARLVTKLGGPIGYKVGLVTKEAQERSGVTNPIRGVLLQGMLLPNRAEVAADYGVNPLVEADLIVSVRDRSINSAATPLDVARGLKEVIAFIELPDSLIATNQKVTGNLLTAVNVGARLGVQGERLPIKATAEFVEALEKMTITLSDGSGREQGKATGGLILGNPLNAVLWLIEDLRKNGKQLQPGDLISLGSVKAVAPQPGQTYTVRYDGLPGGPISVSVKMK